MPTYTRRLDVSLLPSGLTGTLGYTVLGVGGVTLVARTTAGIAEDGSSANYWVDVANWDTAWAGSVVWDAGTGTLARESFVAYTPQTGDSFARLGGAVAANLTQVAGTAIPVPTVPGVPVVDIGYVGGTAASPAATVDANLVSWMGTAPTNLITIADVQTALTNQGYTTGRAGTLDFLDVATSTRLAAAGYTAPANPTDYARNNVAPTWYAAPPTDYQQRNVAVTLPTTVPTGYGGASAATIISTLGTTPVTFRDVTAVTAPTMMDAYAAAFVAAAGAEAVVGTAYNRKTPTGGTFRSFTLATAPGDQARS